MSMQRASASTWLIESVPAGTALIRSTSQITIRRNQGRRVAGASQKQRRWPPRHMAAPRATSTSSHQVAPNVSNGARMGFTRPVGPNSYWKELFTCKTTTSGTDLSGPPNIKQEGTWTNWTEPSMRRGRLSVMTLIRHFRSRGPERSAPQCRWWSGENCEFLSAGPSRRLHCGCFKSFHRALDPLFNTP